MRYTKEEQKEAFEALQKLLKPGDIVFTNLRSVARSGMSRKIKLFIPVTIEYRGKQKPYIRDISWYVSRVLDYRMDDGRALVVGGAGMDMGFHLVYVLSRVLFRDNFICIGEDCPSNDHVNGEVDRTPHKHSDGGYALRHEWI